MMNRSLCSVLYIVLILCSHVQFITAVQKITNKSQQLIKDDKLHSTTSHTKPEEEISQDKDEVKRGWKDNTMQVWGKRGSSPNENLGTISALNHDVLIDQLDRISQSENIKRKWGQNNMPVWGKRNFRNSQNINTDISDPHDSESIEAEKRKWGSNSMTVWGKRSDAHDESIGEYNKRKWNSNSMTVWGKRSEDPLQFTIPIRPESKRKWGDNTMSVWGKRSDSDVIVLDTGSDSDVRPHRTGSDKQDAAAKRKWSDNTMQVWGKRDSDQSTSEHNQHHTVSKRSVRGFNGEYEDLTDGEIWRSLAASGPSGGSPSWGKRGWETNTMRVWGKRSQPYRTRPLSAELEESLQNSDSYVPAWYFYRLTGYREPEKRAWSSDNELRVWG